jgi:hypothetical protein
MKPTKIYSGKLDGEYGFHFSPSGLDPCIEMTSEQHDALFESLKSGQIIKWHDDGNPYIGEAPEPTIEEMIQIYDSAVQGRLDAFAQTRNYASIMSACSYAASANPKFKAEALYCIAARDASWTKCYEIMDAVLSGERDAPTLDELIAELPALEWAE